MKFELEIVEVKHFGYSVLINGEVVMECMSLDEAKEITLADLMQAKEGIE